MTVPEHPIVLVAEDDAVVRCAVQAFLEDRGFVVIEAEDGVQALAVVRSPTPLHLLFTDVQMPHMDGVALAHSARRLRPHLGILVTSGKTQPTALPCRAEFMAKPYDHGAVAGALLALTPG